MLSIYRAKSDNWINSGASRQKTLAIVVLQASSVDGLFLKQQQLA